ncbi:hypothetical protein [Flammeovirga sp. SJP92]|uniref:DUF6913 domain-containing protein n=1 Tax=Flammeovirga sp. SJP92 TaxID=1775430 RepID=UPI0007896DB4|nr:hypothetical protein [Flammeovirga sp. SJP92]KXX68814.1 hypothetical protein AVL50_18435 [Flammeovirga sp. SJP92]
MINLFRNKLLNYKLEKESPSKEIIHNNDLPFKKATSVGFLFYIKDKLNLESLLNEIKILRNILPKSVKNLEIIFVSEFSKTDFEIPFNCKLIPVSKIDWNSGNVKNDLQIFVEKSFDYLFTYSLSISKILDQLTRKSHATCRVTLGEHQDEDFCEMKLLSDQFSFDDRLKSAIEVLNKM